MRSSKNLSIPRLAVVLAVVSAACSGSSGSSTGGNGGAPGAGQGDGGVNGAGAGQGDGGVSGAGGAGDAGTPPGSEPGGGPSPGTGSGAAEDWPQYRHDVRGSSGTGETLTAGDAAALRPVWTQEIGQYGYAQPIRVGDTVYATTAVTGKVHAIAAGDGSIRWTRDLRATLHSDCAAAGEWPGGDNDPGIWGAAAVHDGKLYVGAPDGNVHALDPATGADLFLARVANPTPHAELVESSPTVSDATGRLYVGVAAVAHCDPAFGRMAAVDFLSGATVEQAFVDPGQTGGAVWSSLAVDEPAGTVYATTGNATAPGGAAAQPLTQSIVALDATTLAPRDHWQNAAQGLANCDFGASPTLLEDALGRKLVAAASKDGWLYVLDRTHLSAGPVWTKQLAVSDPADPTHCGDPLRGFGSIVSPAFAGGTLYAAGGRTPDGKDGAVVALDPATGAVRWTHPTPGYVLAPMTVAGDVLVVASNATDNASSTLELLDVHTGATLRSFRGASVTYAGPIVARGLVLWTTFEGHLTALGR